MIIRISGGIGNQMFQYAFKREMDKLTDEYNYIDLRFYERGKIHNGYELEKVFSIKENYFYQGKIKAPSSKNVLLYKTLYKLRKRIYITKRYIMEVLITFYPEFKKLTGNYFYVDGYWQSEDYFREVSDEIRKCFTFPQFEEEKNIALYDVIKNNNCVALHVRRGDFLSAAKFVCLGKTDYYKKAIEYMRDNTIDPFFVVLSDDITWCKANLDLGENVVYVTWNTGEKSYRDMQIMSLCNHNIIANSSFSWWGAWLNNNHQKIVVAPYKFYYGEERDESHLLPQNWVKLHYHLVQ